jgi:hypothetical protein
MSGFRSYPTSDAPESPEPTEVILSLTTVFKMIPLVQQIAGDIVHSHRVMVTLQPEADRLDRLRRNLDWPERKRRYELKEELAKAEKEREIALSELRELGLAALDEVEGRIGFPTMVNNRRAYFSWHLGDVSLQYWHFADELAERPIPAAWLKEISALAKS